MIIGRINREERRVKIELGIKCTNCKIQVPGGIQTSEKYYGTASFYKEIEDFRNNYLCGKCRDKNRIKQKNLRESRK